MIFVKQKKKLSKDAKATIALLLCFAVVMLMYAVNAFYNSYTGEIETEYILNYSEHDTIEVTGFAVRDESSSSVLYKKDGLIYVPIISDSENVSKNGTIALAFSSEAQANAYLEQMELESKLESIKDLEKSADLSYSNILFLNSQINSDVASYAEAVSKSDLTSAQKYIDSISKNLTSKQIAVGKDLDYQSIISDYTKKINTLKSSYTIAKEITSPYAGYFVSSVDGYESAVSYEDVKNKKVDALDGSSLLSQSFSSHTSAYGKIIAQHTWYFIFDVDVSNSPEFKTDYWVKVSFNELGIEKVNMLVYDISNIKDGKFTVTLKCTSMNEKLSKIRKDSASIILDEYEGFKISNDALTENENGVPGVYAVVGNIMKFSPINVLLYRDDYVIAQGVKLLRDENDEDSGYYHVLKPYDKIIVKGLNLKDGDIVE